LIGKNQTPSRYAAGAKILDDIINAHKQAGIPEPSIRSEWQRRDDDDDDDGEAFDAHICAKHPRPKKPREDVNLCIAKSPSGRKMGLI
jgi:hypothetical protein